MEPHEFEHQMKDLLDKIDIKVEMDMLEARIGQHIWKIRKDGHVDPIRSKIISLQDEFEAQIKKMDEEDTPKGKRLAFAERINREILETALLGFKYDEAARNPDIGPVALDYLTKEVASFLVELGGTVGFKHSQMLSKLTLLAASSGSMASRRSTRPSPSNSQPGQTSSNSTD